MKKIESAEKKYKRFPIEVSNGTIMLIQLFSRRNYYEDCWDMDMRDCTGIDYDKNAEQFFLQLEDTWSMAFLLAFQKEIIKQVRKSDKAFGSKHIELFKGIVNKRELNK